MHTKLIYQKHCEANHNIPIFSQPWWLDATIGPHNWSVCLVETNGEVIASMPYIIKKRLGLDILSHPPLTQTLGPWIKKSQQSHAKKLSKEKELMHTLISQLPQYDHFQQNWHHTQQNWLPFYWKGFSATVQYTYQIRDLNTGPISLMNFQENIRGDIRKASNRFKLHIKKDSNISDFIALNEKTFQRQKKSMPYSKEFLCGLDDACAQRNARKIFIAEDEQGKHHAGAYIIWNNYSAYYLMGGADPELRNSGASSFCLYEAIKFASTVTNTFDFEGSMIEPIERFFRGFGAIQTPYLSVSHTPSKPIKAFILAKQLFKHD